MSNEEEPNYKIIEKIGNIEIRKYPNMILASVETKGERSKAINNGFKIIAKYIFGQNSNNQKISMTVPVMQENKSSFNDWKISFIMPSSYNLKTLPLPLDSKIKLNEIPSKKMITIRFSGFISDYNIKKNLEILKKYITDKNYKITGNIIFAFYNPPWTLPFFKRNEIMLEI